jgi:hypothetical protein
MVEEEPGKVRGPPGRKIDAIGDEPHGKKLWRNSVESSRRIREIWGISPGNSLSEVMREAERPIPRIGEGGCDTGQAIGEYAAIRMDGGWGGVRSAMGIIRSPRRLREFAS